MVMFYTNTLCLLSVSMICSIVVHSVQSKNRMPCIIQSILNSKLVSYLTADIGVVSLTTNLFIFQKWYDPVLQWDPKKYGDIKQIYLAPQEVWQPDLSTFNSAGGNDVSPFGETYHIASSDGLISWVPPCQFQVYCRLDLTYWPFDSQVCELILGSWVYDGNNIDFHFEDGNVSMIFFVLPEPLMSVIVILTLASFYLSPSSSEKFLLCGTNMIMTSALLIFFSHKLPLMVTTTPIIVMFYTNTLCLLSVSMICSIVVHSVQSKNRMPCIIQSILNSKLVSYLTADIGVPEHQAMTNVSMLNRQRERTVETKGPQDIYVTTRLIPDRSREWKKLALLIDKALFYMYLAVFVMLAVRCYL
ncbi:neuronal acetylcholine receptor subunit alpha-5 [Diaphorina citri]|uniref:Neuronal acetylcholine receptor subunit alpha-5 n=1 Tax=Diaphorina citri TaxID=121845 RepID=A0A3Q0J479_DIACI|nr:neuronal acetylcholine receptor subunit alpha-5 [Diaphorina citri]